MVESLVPAQIPAESAKPKSAAAKSPKDGFTATAAFGYAREDLEIRMESKDGDVLEVRRSVTVLSGYSRTSGGRGNCGPQLECAGLPAGAGEELEALHRKGGKAEEAGEAGKPAWAEAMQWVRDVKTELEKQQAKLVELLLKGRHDGEDAGGPAGDGRFVMFNFVLMAQSSDGVERELGAMDEEYGVPEYWNAENTSDRIVAFATSFAGVFGDDPGFAETMVEAVAEGFRQAGEILGNLPGKAGKLNRDTHDKVFEKLDNWLEAWRSGAYNDQALNKALEPATLTA